MPKSLAIAGQLRPTQMVGGVASHLQNLCRGIEEVIADDERFADMTVDVFHGPAGTPYRTPRFSYHAMSHRLGRFAADAWYGASAAQNFDATLFTNYFRPPLVRSRRSACVIHDLFDKHFPDLSSWARRTWIDRAQRYTLAHCDRVITISQAVRGDILNYYGGHLADKVTAIWNPIAFERLDGSEEQRFTQGRPYVLGVAVDRPSKNLYTLIRAFEKLSRRDPAHLLVLVGELRSRRPKSRIHSRSVASSMPPTVDLVRELGIDNRVVITGFVSDAELGSLYRGASLFVMPSIFEGFGMPPIEALAMGVPTLVSGIPVLREITLGRAEYLDDPLDADAMAERMHEMLAQGDAARPALDVVKTIRRTFAPATVATRYLEALFDLPPCTSPPDLAAPRRAAASASG